MIPVYTHRAYCPQMLCNWDVLKAQLPSITLLCFNKNNHFKMSTLVKNWLNKFPKLDGMSWPTAGVSHDSCDHQARSIITELAGITGCSSKERKWHFDILEIPVSYCILSLTSKIHLMFKLPCLYFLVNISDIC